MVDSIAGAGAGAGFGYGGGGGQGLAMAGAGAGFGYGGGGGGVWLWRGLAMIGFDYGRVWLRRGRFDLCDRYFGNMNQTQTVRN